MDMHKRLVHEFVHRRVRGIVDLDELLLFREELAEECSATADDEHWLDPDELLAEAWRRIQAEWRQVCSIADGHSGGGGPSGAPMGFEIELYDPLIGKADRIYRGQPRTRGR